MDALDKRLIQLLAEDGRLPVKALASRLGVAAPTVRTRLKNLQDSGVLRVAGMLDPAHLPEITTALIGLNVRSYGKLDEVIERLVEIPGVVWASVVTGRYDVIAEVVYQGGVDKLYELTSKAIPQVGQVEQSETFVVMRSRSKWMCLSDEL